MMTPQLSKVVWKALIRGNGMHAITLGVVGGRLDLRRLSSHRNLEHIETDSWDPRGTQPRDPRTVQIRNAHWNGMDFSGADLSGVRMSECKISNCSFRNCKLDDWRVWTTTFENCDFAGARFRESFLGGSEGRRTCVFQECVFDEADLRGSTHGTALFIRCSFRHAVLKGVSFAHSEFEAGVFEGNLVDVEFYSSVYDKTNKLPQDMIGVDFGSASLQMCRFWKMDLCRAILPNNLYHIPVLDSVKVLGAMRAELAGRVGRPVKLFLGLIDYLNNEAPRPGACSVLSIRDFALWCGDEQLVAEMWSVAEQFRP